MTIPSRVTVALHYQREKEGVIGSPFVAGIRIFDAKKISELKPRNELGFASLYLPAADSNLDATRAVCKYTAIMLTSIFSNAPLPAVFVVRDSGIIASQRLRARAIETLESVGVPRVFFRNGTKPVSLCLPLCEAAKEQKRTIIETFTTYSITGGETDA